MFLDHHYLSISSNVSLKPVQLTILKYVSKLVKQNENTVEPLCQAKGTF